MCAEHVFLAHSSEWAGGYVNGLELADFFGVADVADCAGTFFYINKNSIYFTATETIPGNNRFIFYLLWINCCLQRL